MSSEADAGEVIVNKPTTTTTTTTSTTTTTTTTMTTLTGVKSQPIQFISNKKMTNSLDARSMELPPLHYNPLLNHHTHTNHASSLIEHFATGSFGSHSYLLSTSGGKNTSSNSNLGNNDAKVNMSLFFTLSISILYLYFEEFFLLHPSPVHPYFPRPLKGFPLIMCVCVF